MNAWTRYVYVVLALSPMLLWLVFAPPTVAITAKLVHPAPVQRSTRKSGWLSALLSHVRLICDADTAVATKLVGAESGVAGVLAVAVLEKAELPAGWVACTR